MAPLGGGGGGFDIGGLRRGAHLYTKDESKQNVKLKRDTEGGARLGGLLKRKNTSGTHVVLKRDIRGGGSTPLHRRFINYEHTSTHALRADRHWGVSLAFTRYYFTSRLLWTIQPSFHSPRPPALATLVEYYRTTIGQYTTPPPPSRVYAIHHTIFVTTISCKGQGSARAGLQVPCSY